MAGQGRGRRNTAAGLHLHAFRCTEQRNAPDCHYSVNEHRAWLSSRCGKKEASPELFLRGKDAHASILLIERHDIAGKETRPEIDVVVNGIEADCRVADFMFADAHHAT